MSNVVEGLKYTKGDEWIRVEGNVGTIGLTDYAQNALNDIVYVELPSVGAVLARDGAFGTVESVKAASEMHMPAGGTVTAVNEALESEPEIVNSDPYGAGWFIKITLSNPAELDDLMDAAAYAEYCAGRD